jgi:hypothetical protein
VQQIVLYVLVLPVDTGSLTANNLLLVPVGLRYEIPSSEMQIYVEKLLLSQVMCGVENCWYLTLSLPN